MPGRKGLGNIIITQELIHSIDKKKGRMRFMAVKVDLAMAYDSALSELLYTGF